jgi:hypothetical protein
VLKRKNDVASFMILEIYYGNVLDVIGVIWKVIGVEVRNTTRKLIPYIVSPSKESNPNCIAYKPKA